MASIVHPSALNEIFEEIRNKPTAEFQKADIFENVFETEDQKERFKRELEAKLKKREKNHRD